MGLTLDSGLMHASFREHTAAIGWREIKNFAAALHDFLPAYFDDERTGGVVAPPTFPVALTWPIVAHLNDYFIDATFPPELLNTIVHYSEHLVLTRLLRHGEKLSIRTQIPAIASHKSGTLLFLQFNAWNETGEMVFQESTGALLRGVTCTGTSCKRQEDVVPHIHFPGEDALLWKKTLAIDPLLPYIYDGCTNIVFPIHTSVKFAHRAGLPGIIVQGTATLGLVLREFVHLQLKGNPARVREIHAQFSAMIFPGTEIEIQFYQGEKIGKLQRFYFRVLTDQKKPALKNGWILVEPEAN